MAILTCKQTCECISLQIFSKYPIQKSRDRTNPPDLPTLKAYPTPGVGGRFGIFSLKWRERMNLKVPGAILPLGCAILSTRAKTVLLRRQQPVSYINFCNCRCPILIQISGFIFKGVRICVTSWCSGIYSLISYLPLNNFLSIFAHHKFLLMGLDWMIECIPFKTVH